MPVPRRPEPVVLDACVLAPPSLCDLLLRLAESPALYAPRWSERILDEVARTQLDKLPRRYTAAQVIHWRTEVGAAFPEALCPVDPSLVARLKNHPKDRHVLAAAIGVGARTIVTANLRDFPPSATLPWDIRALHPQDFLSDLLEHHEGVVRRRLFEMADGEPPDVPLRHLAAHVPKFVELIRGV